MQSVVGKNGALCVSFCGNMYLSKAAFSWDEMVSRHFGHHGYLSSWIVFASVLNDVYLVSAFPAIFFHRRWTNSANIQYVLIQYNSPEAEDKFYRDFSRLL